MELSLNDKDKDRLKKVLLLGSALVAAGATVKYIRDNEGVVKGYIYRLNKGKDWLVGAYREEETMEIVQISGGLNARRGNQYSYEPELNIGLNPFTTVEVLSYNVLVYCLGVYVFICLR
jgi:hypothetical protein